MGGNASEPSAKKSQFFDALNKFQSDENEYEYLSRITHFDIETLRLLHVRFGNIDKSIDKDARISLTELAKCLGLSPSNILLNRFFKYMDNRHVGLTFRIFAKTMSLLSIQSSHDDKIKLSFYLYDLNDDGFIDKMELKQLIMDSLDQLKPLKLTGSDVDIIIENTFDAIKKMDDDDTKSVEDKISFNEYRDFMKQSQNLRLLQYFSFDIKQLVKFEKDARKAKMMRYESTRNKILHHGPYAEVVKEEKNVIIGNLKKQDTIRFFDEVVKVHSIHDANDIGISPTDCQQCVKDNKGFFG